MRRRMIHYVGPVFLNTASILSKSLTEPMRVEMLNSDSGVPIPSVSHKRCSINIKYQEFLWAVSDYLPAKLEIL